MKDVFVARQPIFDAKHRIQAYELLYRDPASDSPTAEGLPDAPASALVDGVLEMGMGRLTEGQTAFVHIPERLLSNGIHEALDPQNVVLEILDAQPTAALRDALERLKSLGYRLALDECVLEEGGEALLAMADVVKVDVTRAGEGLERLAARLDSPGVRLLAEKVETATAHQRCVELGFELFQGFHYFRPDKLSKGDLSTGTITIIRLMGLLGDMSVTDRAIEEAFKSDPSLSYKLLQLVNSAAIGGRGVDSIAHALRLMGRDPLYRWLSLLLLTVGRDGGEVRMEMIKSALLRGRMCELVGDAARSALTRDMPSGGTLFLVGLFSHLDVLLGADMATVLENIDVTQDVHAALVSHEGKAGAVLQGVVDYTEAEWESAERHLQQVGLNPDVLGDLYMDAVAWAGAHMAFHEKQD